MIDYKTYFTNFCTENNLEISLSYEMPVGYETAYGTFDAILNTLFINKSFMANKPDYEQLFYLFHELRHAMQNLHREKFSDHIRKSCQYVIMYNGHCYKRVQDDWKECDLEGDTEYFSALYLGQACETDANKFAYDTVKKILGESSGLNELYSFWTPKVPILDDEYERIYSKIDNKVK